MQKVIVIVNGASQVCSLFSGLTAESVAAGYGVTDPAFYQEFAESDFDPACYLYSNAFILVGGVVGFDLPNAKTIAKAQAQQETGTQQQTVLAGYTSEAVAGQSALAEIDRIPAVQAVIVATNALSEALAANLAAIAAAATIDEVNNVVNPPGGILFTGRGAGAGPQDLNPSYYTEFNSASMLPPETELFVPGTTTVIPYNNSFPPYEFDSAGNCFALDNYLLQIRETATGQVIAEFECPLAPTNVDVPF